MHADARSLLAWNLRRLRIIKGWSQQQLAEHSGLHRSYVGAVERGERNIGLDNLERLALALQTPLDALLDSRAQHRQLRDAQTPYQTGRSESACRVFLAICRS